jgi:hypothetical protein
VREPWYACSSNMVLVCQGRTFWLAVRLTLIWCLMCSKTYCPYCRSVKELLKGLGAEAKVVELDKEGKTTRAPRQWSLNLVCFQFAVLACNFPRQY